LFQASFIGLENDFAHATVTRLSAEGLECSTPGLKVTCTNTQTRRLDLLFAAIEYFIL
jgi:hypothetical protein